MIEVEGGASAVSGTTDGSREPADRGVLLCYDRAVQAAFPTPRSVPQSDRREGAKRLTIVIPAFNEEQHLGRALAEVFEQCADFVAEVIVVDDCSEDATAEVASRAGARVLRHRDNRGYGAALKTGILASRTEYVLTMDGDGQHRGEDVRRLWEHTRDHDMVVGQRPEVLHTRLWRLPGKWVLWTIANYLVKRRIPDLNSGLRLMRRDQVVKYLHICPSGFSFSTTITMAFLSRGQHVEYVPIKVRAGGKSTVRIKTGLDTFILILRTITLFNPLRLFIPLSLISVALGLAWGLPMVLAREGLSVGAMQAITTGMLLFFMGLLSDQVSQLRLERFEISEAETASLTLEQFSYEESGDGRSAGEILDAEADHSRAAASSGPAA